MKTLISKILIIIAEIDKFNFIVCSTRMYFVFLREKLSPKKNANFAIDFFLIINDNNC